MVKVMTPASGTTSKDHADGDSVAVSDGHLLVSQYGEGVVAIYAPGNWRSAVVEK